MAFAQKKPQPVRTAFSIRVQAEETLAEQSFFSMSVRIGICYWTFTISRVGYGETAEYSLRKGADVIVDHRSKVDHIITDLLDQVQAYI